MAFRVHRSYKRKRHDLRSTLPVSVQRVVEGMFEKKFVYNVAEEDDLTLGLDLYENTSALADAWSINNYIVMKDELNTLKDNLNDKDMISWHEHTRAVNIAAHIAPEVRNRLRPELCTQAWCKFYEIACTFLQDLQVRPSLFTVHLCEAPGAFVCSLNQYLYTLGYKGCWQWLATTLNPYYEGNSTGQMINEDRLISVTYDNWYFGEDGTGNLMSAKNLEGLKNRLEGVHVDLVTADGSIDCQFDPAEQENVVSRLQYCETITALHVLGTGGTFVVKLFTMFEDKSVCLMYLINRVFEKVTVFKPSTSKSGNSEIYVICEGYRGRDACQHILHTITPWYFGEREPTGVLFPRSAIPTEFLIQHTRCIEQFKVYQMSAIHRNLDLYRAKVIQEKVNQGKVTSEPERSRPKPIREQQEEKSEVNRKQNQVTDTKSEKMEICASSIPVRSKISSNGINVGAKTVKSEESNSSRTLHDNYIGISKESRSTRSSNDLQRSSNDLQRPQNDLEMSPAEKSSNNLECEAPEKGSGPTNDIDLERSQYDLDFFKVGYADEMSRLEVEKDYCVECFFSRYDIKPLDHRSRIMKSSKSAKTNRQKKPEFSEQVRLEGKFMGSFQDRQKLASLPWRQKLATMATYESDVEVEDNSLWLQSCNGFITDTDISSWFPSSGLPIQEIRCSRFVPGFYLSQARDLVHNVEWLSREAYKISNDLQSTIVHNLLCTVNTASSAQKSAKNVISGNTSSRGSSQNQAGVTSQTHQDDLASQAQATSQINQGGLANQAEVISSTNPGTNINDETQPSHVWHCVHHDVGRRMKQCSIVLSEITKQLHYPSCSMDQESGTSTHCLHLYQACSDTITKQFEVVDQESLYQVVLHIIENCKAGESVVLEIGTCLSRLTAGLVYCLYRTFKEIGFLHHHGQMMKRHLVCANFQHCPIRLQQYLNEAGHMIHIDQSETLLEIIPVLHILEDVEFSNFLQISNINLLQSFITTVVNHERSSHGWDNTLL